MRAAIQEAIALMLAVGGLAAWLHRPGGRHRYCEDCPGGMTETRLTFRQFLDHLSAHKEARQ